MLCQRFLVVLVETNLWFKNELESTVERPSPTAESEFITDGAEIRHYPIKCVSIKQWFRLFHLKLNPIFKDHSELV